MYLSLYEESKRQVYYWQLARHHAHAEVLREAGSEVAVQQDPPMQQVGGWGGGSAAGPAHAAAGWGGGWRCSRTRPYGRWGQSASAPGCYLGKGPSGRAPTHAVLTLVPSLCFLSVHAARATVGLAALLSELRLDRCGLHPPHRRCQDAAAGALLAWVVGRAGCGLRGGWEGGCLLGGLLNASSWITTGNQTNNGKVFSWGINKNYQAFTFGGVVNGDGFDLDCNSGTFAILGSIAGVQKTSINLQSSDIKFSDPSGAPNWLTIAATGDSCQGTFTANQGFISTATNRVAMTSGGLTNLTGVNLRVCDFTGTSVLYSNNSVPFVVSKGTITIAKDIILQAGEALIGTSCASVTNIAF